MELPDREIPLRDVRDGDWACSRTTGQWYQLSGVKVDSRRVVAAFEQKDVPPIATGEGVFLTARYTFHRAPPSEAPIADI